MHEKPSIYERVTATILAQIASNPGQPVMPWHRSAGSALSIPRNATTSAQYRGMNILMLWLAADIAGYKTGTWASYRQWATTGAQVRRGERATSIIFYKQFDVEPTGPDDDGTRAVARTSAVFNEAQLEGYDDTPETLPDHGPICVTDAFRTFVAATGATIHHHGDRAFYAIKSDDITMPPEALFTGTATTDRHLGYASTLSHELAHYSGASHRLDRKLATRHGTHAHAAEEVIAEITASFVCARLGLASEPRIDHAQYIAHYMSMMRDDPRAIFKCAADAARAADYLFAFSEPTKHTGHNSGDTGCHAGLAREVAA
jgi:antirestriction protein ArdC